MRVISVLYLITLLWCGISHSAGQTLEPPQNTAVVEHRSNSRVNCTASPNTDVLVWSHSLFPSGEYAFWSSDNPTSYDPRFTVEVNEAGTRYDLIIIYPNSTCAGTFHVALQDAGTKYSVELVVLSGLDCHPEETGKETDEGLELVVTATTAYYGSMEPSMYWYSQGQQLNTYAWQVNRTKTVMYNSTASPDNHGSEYYGKLLFEENQAGLTPPSYTDTCYTMYTVLYAVQDMAISPYPAEGEDLYAPPGSIFNCTAIANPAPDFYWYCNNGLIHQGARLTVPEDALDEMICICEGQNFFNGRLHEASTNVTFTTSATDRLGTPTVWTLLISTVTLNRLLSKYS